MVASGAVLLSTPGVTLPSRVLRQSLGAMFRPAAAALTASAGALAGPAGTMGELTLLTDLLCRVNPAVFVINGTHNAKQGQYIVPNDELVDLNVPAKDAAQFRKAYIAVRVADSTEAGVAPGALTDIPGVIEVQPGALAAANPALPNATPNTLYLGELSIPSTASGQPVTITKYDPRTTMRGGTLPVIVDGQNRPGHDGEPGVFVGQYRDHPVNGEERWDGARWASVAPLGVWVDDVFSTTYGAAVTGYANPPSMGGRNVVVPPGRQLQVEVGVGQANVGAASNLSMELYLGGTRQDGFSLQYPGAGVWTGPIRMRGHWTNTGNVPAGCDYSVTAVCPNGSASLNAAAYGVVRLRRRVV